MDQANVLRSIYAGYVQQVETLLKNIKPADGLLGMGNAPQNAPCHDLFDQQVEQFVRQQVDAPDAAALAEIVELLLRGEKDHPLPACGSWMLIAVQRHSLPLIPHLLPDDAQCLLDWYQTAYPVFHRLPAQKEIIQQLKKRTKA